MKITFYTLLIGAVFITSCSSKVYNNKSYIRQSSLAGKKVAIIPVEVELTGRMPKNFTATAKSTSEESESRLIQNQIYSQFLYKSKSDSKKKQHVELINVDQVNSKLQQAGISLRDSWNMSPDSLGKLIGADLVLKVKVKKNRIMSESASFGIGVAGSILDNILSKDSNSSVGGSAKTYNMFLDATLSDVSSHVVITKFSYNGDASWNRMPEQIIESSGRKFVRKGVIYAQN
jgi:hypothetical protein